MVLYKNRIAFATDNEELFLGVVSGIKTLIEHSEDGYEIKANSFSIKEPARKKSFSDALSAIKLSKSVRLPSWPPDSVIRMQLHGDDVRISCRYLCLESDAGSVPWMPNLTELLSEEWEIVD